ncbi:MAG: flagellar type III secretion system pore protein FliP [Spirochaetes bacterium]|nr:flagellar type III secretion system pore protein FliP [Spirochaetota bacterium]
MKKKIVKIVAVCAILILVTSAVSRSAPVRIPIPKITIGVDEAKRPSDVSLALEILALLSIITLAPAIIMMVTSFIRILIVFSFISRALATQQMPPMQILTALSLFLTFFIMSPALNEMNEKALQPYLARQISADQFYERGIQPIRQFMFKQTREKDISLFIHLGKQPRPKNRDDVPTYVLIPSFILSELNTAFKIGILIFIPFIIIDLVVASTLMSMGMIMLPPVMISLPLKIVLFVLVDGWHLITYSMVRSFH